MDKKITVTVTVHNLTEDDLREEFQKALTGLDSEGGYTVPRDLIYFKERVIKQMFYPAEEKGNEK